MTETKASLLRLFNLNRTWCKITKQTRKTNQSFIYHPIKINDFNDFNFELKVFDWFLNNYLLTATQTHLSVTDIVVYLSIHCSLFSFRFETPTQVFSCELCKIFKNTYFEEMCKRVLLHLFWCGLTRCLVINLKVQKNA